MTPGTCARALTRRTAAICRGSRASPTAAVPSVTFIRPVSASSRHVRPDPDGPSTATSDPGSASTEIPRTAHPLGPLIPRPSAAIRTPPVGSPTRLPNN